jgi:hypothetical protein
MPSQSAVRKSERRFGPPVLLRWGQGEVGDQDKSIVVAGVGSVG